MALIAQKILLLRQMCMTCFQRTEKEYMDNPPVGIELPTFQCEFAESSIGTEDAPRTTRRKKADVDSMTARCAHCNANNRTCAPYWPLMSGNFEDVIRQVCSIEIYLSIIS